MTCATCRFWIYAEGKQIERVGTCQRRAPVVDTARQLVRVWPETRAIDHCGDYERRHDA
jgi:hypothetical protein